MTNRYKLYNVLKTLNYPVENIGKSYKFKDSPYLVLRYAGLTNSINRIGGYDTWEVQVYVPDTSMVLLDAIIDKVDEVLVTNFIGIESTGLTGADTHDTEIGMYMNYVQFRVPRLLRRCAV